MLAYPEYRGNGVMASLGNISENPNIGLLLVDFVRDRVGPHVNGRARIVEDTQLRREFEGVSVDFEHGRTPERWVVVDVEAYIHCRKHIPRMQSAPSERGWHGRRQEQGRRLLRGQGLPSQSIVNGSYLI